MRPTKSGTSDWPPTSLSAEPQFTVTRALPPSTWSSSRARLAKSEPLPTKPKSPALPNQGERPLPAMPFPERVTDRCVDSASAPAALSARLFHVPLKRPTQQLARGLAAR